MRGELGLMRGRGGQREEGGLDECVGMRRRNREVGSYGMGDGSRRVRQGKTQETAGPAISEGKDGTPKIEPLVLDLTTVAPESSLLFWVPYLLYLRVCLAVHPSDFISHCSHFVIFMLYAIKTQMNMCVCLRLGYIVLEELWDGFHDRQRDHCDSKTCCPVAHYALVCPATECLRHDEATHVVRQVLGNLQKLLEGRPPKH